LGREAEEAAGQAIQYEPTMYGIFSNPLLKRIYHLPFIPPKTVQKFLKLFKQRWKLVNICAKTAVLGI